MCLVNYEIENFEFLLGMNIWYDILFAVNSISKTIQSKDMHINVVIKQLKGLISYLKTCRENGFESAINSIIEMANEMNIELIFRERCMICRKRQFDESNDDEITHSAKKSFEVEYFKYIMDHSITFIETRFEQLAYENIFGFLFDLNKLKTLEDDKLKKSCLNLETYLRFNEHSDIDGFDLFSGLKVLKGTLNIETNTPIEILNYIKRLYSFPNACISYRILLTAPITVTSTKRNFSKLKVLKNYLR